MQKFVNQPPVLCGSKCEFPPVSLPALLAEPCLFSNSEEGVLANGGPFAKAGLEHIQGAFIQDIYNAKQEGLSAVIDVRVQRLMPGMFPSIPGWHCDAVPRNNYQGQPHFDAINPFAFHVAKDWPSCPAYSGRADGEILAENDSSSDRNTPEGSSHVLPVLHVPQTSHCQWRWWSAAGVHSLGREWLVNPF
jgi:hypothetical protein